MTYVDKLKIEELIESCYSEELGGYFIPEFLSDEIFRLLNKKFPEFVYDIYGNLVKVVG